tara:strand:- start:153 stop:1673 length:1521 start_codon:yes stop_codon:yes gene_type:complete
MIRWQDVQQGIFQGESGGDYDALFGFQNRPDGLFSDIKLTDMTLDQVLKFADPRGEYASYVKENNKGTISTPMGAYQIVGRTLRDAKNALGLSGDTKFTKETQDKIAKYILKTQGTDAWKGYKGTRVPPQAQKGTKKMAQNTPNPFQMQQMAQMRLPQTGVMGFLSDPRNRAVLSSFSNTNTGKRLNQLAQYDIKQETTRNLANRTANYLRSQEGGEIFAKGIDAGLDPKEMYENWYKSTKGDPDENFSLTPQILVNPETGEKQLLQMGSGGNTKITKLPEGFVLNTKGYDKIDLGTKWGFMDVNTGRMAYTVEKNIAAQVEEQTTAEKKTEQKVDAQGSIQKVRLDTDAAFVLIDRIKENRSVLPMILGSVRGNIPKEGLKGKAAFNQQQIDLITDIDSLSGLVGTQAYQSLRGAGAITKDELQIAIEGLGNLTRVQSVDSFIRNLNALQERLSGYLAIAEQQAAQEINVEIDSDVKTQTEAVTPFNSNAQPDATRPDVERVEID